MSGPNQTSPILVEKITGPNQVILGGRVVYAIKKYSRTSITPKEKSTIKWAVVIFRPTLPNRIVKEYLDPLPKRLFIVKEEALIIRRIPDEWRYADLHVYAYIVKPVNRVRVISKILGAWSIRNMWTNYYIKLYRDSLYQYASYLLKTKGEKFVCEDFVITNMMLFARQHRLPFRIQNGTGVYDAKGYHYGKNGARAYQSMEHRVLVTTGAHDLMAFRINTIAIKNGRIWNNGKVDEVTVRKIKAGDFFLLEFDTDGQANHVQLVTKIIPVPLTPTKTGGKQGIMPMPKIKIAQGNFPSGFDTTARWIKRIYQGNPNDPEAANYYGVEVQEAVYDFNAQTYTRKKSSKKPVQQIFFVARWNVHGW